NSPLVLAGKLLDIPTISIVHGSINPIGNYIPVLSSNLFVWGKFHVDQFKKYNSTNPNIYVVGNPKVRLIKRSHGNKKMSKIGLGTTKLSTHDRITLVDIFLQGTEGYFRAIKIHPLEDLCHYRCYELDRERVEVLDGNMSV